MEEDKSQITIIHGGEIFESNEKFYKSLEQTEFNPHVKSLNWKNWLELTLADEFEFLFPKMPNKNFADYKAWKIWFEKLFPYFNNEKLILIGHSLGGIFLAKYLSENKFPKKINQLHFVSAVFEETDEFLGNFKFNISQLQNIKNQADKIFIYHSKDDPVVPFSHALQYKKYLPEAELIEFDSRGHLNQPYFLEILQRIKSENF